LKYAPIDQEHVCPRSQRRDKHLRDARPRDTERFSNADIITKTHAIEVEWAHKWYERFGQALWYGFQTNKKPGLVLIFRNKEDERFLARVRSLAAHHEIEPRVWTID